MASRLASKVRRQQRIDDGLDDRAAKLQRVLNIKGTSSQALQDIMGTLEVENASAKLLSDVGQARFSTMAKTITLPKRGGGFVEWELCNPSMLLFRVISESPALQAIFEQAMAQSPSTPEHPWNVLVGWDEFTPGNKLAVQNNRMTMVLSFSFEELGSALSMDMTWFTPVAVRTTLINEVDGGWSRMLKEFLKVLLFSANGLQGPGVAIQLRNGRVATLHGRVQRLLSDGDGLRKAMEWMGHASLKPCWRHWNVFRKGCGLPGEDSSRKYEDITCTDPRRFKAWAESDFHEAIDVVVEAHRMAADGRMTKGDCEETQRAFWLSRDA